MLIIGYSKRNGYEIGVKAVDRYERDRSLEGRALARPVPDIATRTRPFLSTLAEIARGRNVETGLHNVSAYVRNAVWRSKMLPFRQRLRKSAGRRRDWRLRQMRQQSHRERHLSARSRRCCQLRVALTRDHSPALKAAGRKPKTIPCFLSIFGL
jgi:hypothetical protein